MWKNSARSPFARGRFSAGKKKEELKKEAYYFVLFRIYSVFNKKDF